MLGRGQQRVEEQLAVLAARVALAGQRPPAEHVVAVDGVAAREDAVVEADEADHAVRHRAHRHHRADRERAGAEVGAGRSAGQPRLRAARGRRRAAARVRRLARRGRGPGQLALELRQLPGVVAGDLGRASRTPAAQRVHPLVDRGRAARARPGSRRAGRASSASRPARSISLLPTSSSGSPRPRWRWSSPLIATPSSTRSSPERQVLLAKRSIENALRATRRRAPTARRCRPPSGPSGRGRRR